ncbi:MAG: N-acetyl sugar amidotransferase [Chitinophagaceae bacterium]|nr:N-acetyl sugar amidotransferase [Chitinophagaceae bacterium]
MAIVFSKTDPGYMQCSLSVMDNIADPDISFDDKGICNYYYEYREEEKENVLKGDAGEKRLASLISSIKENGKGKPYDCVTGISGGVDSSYLVWKAKEWGLRPLIVHFDNGWNSETAVSNINNIIRKTGFDLYTIVVNWEEFKDLQLAYIKASVVDIEVPTDHAISGTLQTLAAKYKLKYILSGNNVVTEAILPRTWIYNKGDYVNLRNIHRKYGTLPLKTYPLFGFREQYIYGAGKGIETVRPLNFIDYNKAIAKQTITEELGWKDYGGKHYESVFTKFYQAYILPVKFHIDKRKPHLSTLVFSGQITKQQALEELEKPLYEETELQQEMDYVLKKFGLTRDEFENYMKQPRIEHAVFGRQKHIYKRFPILKVLNAAYKSLKK